MPEPMPAWDQCEITEVVPAPGWYSFDDPYGDPPGDVLLIANSVDDEVQNGQMLSGFQFVVGNPDFCCFVVQFLGPEGEVMVEQEECFNCTLVGNEDHAWGAIKSIYR